MARIFIAVEGETEESFVNVVLAPHLLVFGHVISARLMGNSRLRVRRGGIQGWPGVAQDIVRRLSSDPNCFLTTMVDYYALPSIGTGAWPGRAAASHLPFPRKALHVQQEIAKDIQSRMDANLQVGKLIPYVMMHESEGLLFSDCSAFARGVARPGLEPKLQAIRDQFGSPEEIIDSPITAPSKRVEALIPGYEKPFMGTLAVLEIGLAPIRKECPLFSAWLSNLEALS